MPAVVSWVPPPEPDFQALWQEAHNAFRRDKPKVIAFDTETTGYEYHDRPFCVTMAWERPAPKIDIIGTGPGPKNVKVNDIIVTYGQYKKWKDEGPGIEAHYLELDDLSKFLWVHESLMHADILIGHNIKFDIHKSHTAGIASYEEFFTKTLEDTEALAHLDDEHRRKGLKELAVSVLGYEDYVEVEVKSGKRKGEIDKVPREKFELEAAKKWAKKELGYKSVEEVGYHQLPRGVIVPYAIKDAEFTLMLWKMLRPRIERHQDLYGLYLQEMHLTKTLIEMEAQGLGVDVEYVDAKVKEYGKRIVEHEMRIEGIVGKPVRTGKMKEKEKPCFFNPNSNPQIKEYLTEAGFPRDSYDDEHLAGIDHPFAQALRDLRGDTKIRNNWLMSLQKNTRDRVYHPSIRQHGTVTGRTSSGSEKGDA